MIQLNENSKVFTLHTNGSSYQMKVDEYGVLLHTYYGKKIREGDMSCVIHLEDRGFSPNPPEADGGRRREYSLDFLPQEFASSGVGDFRQPSIVVKSDNGSSAADFRYVSHEIKEGKYMLDGLPAFYDMNSDAQTLVITLRDPYTQIEVDLLYGVFEQLDLITRSVVVRNIGSKTVYLDRIMSLCLDILDAGYDFIHLDGAYGRERSLVRAPLVPGEQSISSIRGASSHQHNPFCVLCEQDAGEDHGLCIGAAFVYSGNYLISAERTQFDHIRLVMGINPYHFCFELKPGETFTAPEVALVCTDQGLTGLTHRFHRAIRNNLCRGPWKHKRRPLLINNWEATEFNFDANKIVSIAEKAATVGIEMMVMDDGWFGHRNDDRGGLGDWNVNEQKLPGGLSALTARIKECGMKFGIWVEPEAVSEDSDLYREHPDWALQIPDRPPTRGRSQLHLDLSRPEVCAYILDRLRELLKSADISYLKWDMNRSMCDVWSCGLEPARQGEVFHRYILGLYGILEQLYQEFPNVLIEGCSGGGGRFDCGMLYYQPQIWASDNTDAIERLSIQYGTAFCYPSCTIGAHVSAVPNIFTGRRISMHTRSVIAMQGTFGYELDLNKLDSEDIEVVRRQNELFKEYHWLVDEGTYYRLASPFSEQPYTACMFVAPDRSCALVNYVNGLVHGNPIRKILKLKGLDPDTQYQIGDRVYGGDQLMYSGVPLPRMGEYEAVQLYLSKIT